MRALVKNPDNTRTIAFYVNRKSSRSQATTQRLPGTRTSSCGNLNVAYCMIRGSYVAFLTIEGASKQKRLIVLVPRHFSVSSSFCFRLTTKEHCRHISSLLVTRIQLLFRFIVHRLLTYFIITSLPCCLESVLLR